MLLPLGYLLFFEKAKHVLFRLYFIHTKIIFCPVYLIRFQLFHWICTLMLKNNMNLYQPQSKPFLLYISINHKRLYFLKIDF